VVGAVVVSFVLRWGERVHSVVLCPTQNGSSGEIVAVDPTNTVSATAAKGTDIISFHLMILLIAGHLK
jgi:hypothetical protein